MSISYEKYEHAIAGAVFDLRDRIKKNLSPELFESGIIKAKAMIYDGTDGFDGFHLVAEKSERSCPTHGLAADFTVHSITAMPNKSKKVE